MLKTTRKKCTAKETAGKEKTESSRSIYGFLDAFVMNTLGGRTSCGNYSVTRQDNLETLIFTAYHTAYNEAENGFKREIEAQEMLAVRLEGGLVLSNADRLKFCGSRFVFGRRLPNIFGQSWAQMSLEKAGALEVPFRIFAEAGLEIGKAKIVEKAPPEILKIEVRGYSAGRWTSKDEPRHFAGACLLKINGSYFLFDIDREDIRYKVFNAFIVKLAQPVQSISEAYISLKPDEVLEAEKEDRRVKRQGEWFFIKRFNKLPELHRPCEALLAIADSPPDARTMGASRIFPHYTPGLPYGFEFSNKDLAQSYKAKVKEWERVADRVRHAVPHRGELRHGNRLSHAVEELVLHEDRRLVSGLIIHRPGEHKTLQLKGWWEAVPNKAAQSWKINGDID